MKIGNVEITIIESKDMPGDEVWLVDPGVREIYVVKGKEYIVNVRDPKVLARIIGLDPKRGLAR